MSDALLQQFSSGLMDDANGAPDLVHFRQLLIRRIDSLIGIDTATVLPVPTVLGGDDDTCTAVSRGLDRNAFEHYLQNRTRYWRDMSRVARAFTTNQGLVIDAEIFNAREKQSLPIYVEAMIPAGIACVLSAVISFRGRTTGMLCLNRHGSSGFRPQDLERLRAVSMLVGMADAAVGLRGATIKDAARCLSSREKQVATLIRCGLQNKEIAAFLGTSVDTVRKQTIRVYEKLGVSGRIGLVVRLGGAPTPPATCAPPSVRAGVR